MQQPSSDIDRWTRFDCARHVATCILAIAERQQDRYGWVGLNAHGRTGVPARTGPRHLDRCIVALDNAIAQGQWPAAAQLDRLWEAFGEPGLIVLISDFYQQSNEVVALAAKLRAAGNEVLALQLVTRAEVDFNYRGNHEFVDRETGQRVQTHAPGVRAAYRRNFENAHDVLRAALARHAVTLHRTTIETPLDSLIRVFLDARERASGRAPAGAA